MNDKCFHLDEKDFSGYLPIAINKLTLVKTAMDCCLQDLDRGPEPEVERMWAGICLLETLIAEFERISVAFEEQ